MKPEGEGSGQYGEDRILALVFGHQPTGFLVDVGAADGFWNSNSIGLLRRPGWEGVLIEPEEAQYKALKERYLGRAGVTCIWGAVGLESGEKTLWAGGHVSTFKQGVRASAIQNHGIDYRDQKVWMAPLTGILQSLHIHSREIDFLSIDAEGMDYEVWRSLDKKFYSPKLVCIEGKKYRMDGYKELCRTAGNTFYLREDLCPAL